MTLTLMMITNDPRLAFHAEAAGVDWIFVDLEIKGKLERQGHLDTVISRHSVQDVALVKGVLKSSKLLVRVNPVHDGSEEEIEAALRGGADVVMLPFFSTVEEVQEFTGIVNGRAETCLLLETPGALALLDSILDIPGIDAIHVGLNDLHLGLRRTFMFELLADGTVDDICMRVRSRGIKYGFGGIARLGSGELPAERIVAEHYRLGSTMAILSRSFLSDHAKAFPEEARGELEAEVRAIREYETLLRYRDEQFFESNRGRVATTVAGIVARLASPGSAGPQPA
ncbi:aldolase/citrate lyase family protein [Tessaracoccus sp. MC1756]|uniref:aldolase/citrate lyase family protein n=1 Tax=Tessaracoccus sp. MC1756 TaxID=2760311 RepID=UPI0016049469|nr:aldolase/citrate lyase family protein [Tessaracoccus sp. MC1756]MBB1509823.1 aldolase [Tessaracoccus sp. MC1756]